MGTWTLRILPRRGQEEEEEWKKVDPAGISFLSTRAPSWWVVSVFLHLASFSVLISRALAFNVNNNNNNNSSNITQLNSTQLNSTHLLLPCYSLIFCIEITILHLKSSLFTRLDICALIIRHQSRSLFCIHYLLTYLVHLGLISKL